MKKAIWAALLCAASATCVNGQVTPVGPIVGSATLGGDLYASNFGQWKVPKGDLGQYSWRQSSACYVAVSGITIKAFTAGTPIEIVDTDNASLNEIVTPSAVSTLNGCSITVSPTHGHNHFYLTSGTAGLQEALNWAGSAAYVVVLTPDWTLLGGTTAMITSATAGASTTILDARTAMLVYYSGTTPAITPTTLGIQNATAGGLVIAGSASAPGSITINGSGAAPGAITLQPNTAATALTLTNASGSMNLLLGTDASGDGRLYTSNSAAAAHTIWGSAATTTNTIKGFATTPANNGLVSCATSSTTCTFADSGVTASGGLLTASLYASATNCAVNSVSPAACAAAPAGAFVVPTSTTTYTVNTSAVTATSRIILQPVTFAADLPSTPTCVAPAVTSAWSVSGITAGTSFTIALPSTTGATCWYYSIEN